MRQIPPKWQQLNLLQPDPPGYGGKGGERESEANILQVTIWDGIQWPDAGPTEPDVFWAYWLREDKCEAEVSPYQPQERAEPSSKLKAKSAKEQG